MRTYKPIVELVEFRSPGVVVRKSSGALHLANDRKQGAVGGLRGAEITQSRVRFGGDTLKQRGSQSRLADARFAR
jgi:hypothetical protein